MMDEEKGWIDWERFTPPDDVKGIMKIILLTAIDMIVKQRKENIEIQRF